MTLTEFERIRQQNIKRNKELLSKLNLDSISGDISNEIARSASTSSQQQSSSLQRKKTVRSSGRVSKKEKKVVEPARRSRRLAGIKSEAENPEEYARHREQEEAKERQKREYENLKRTKLFGDFNLIDLITDRKKGDMVFEDKVRNKVKSENDGDGDGDKDYEDLVKEESEVLKLIQLVGDKFSAGDFYEKIKKHETNSNKSIDAKRKEFESMHIYPKFDPLEIKLTHNRITSISFHPSTTDRIVAAGDTNGNLGIWAPDSNSEDPTISILRPHGRNISKILTPRNQLQKLISASYDGSVRSLDLNKLSTSEVIYLSDAHNSEFGVSDINFVREDPNLLYLSTLEGIFARYDLRSKPKRHENYLRLHDKKIGGFAINPNNSYQIATASLDRTLRIWDLRKIGPSVYSEFEKQKSPHMYGNYVSRLSISTVDWNIENRLVCNGYDDQICIFNYNKEPKITKWQSDYLPNYKHPEVQAIDEIILPDNLKPVNKIKHNCQTGRWVSILKSKWQEDPQDGMQKFIIANMKRGMDVYDQEGHILAHLNDQIGAVPAVCTLHPTQNWSVGGSASGKIYLIE
ncbi:hypothetical protein KGF56_002406 [Candida oxycetoniae]|uniref:DNA damage-binding protein CMR1 n=1 Tax=Candida oxycetoniae TaxID=497107 RepID=A0AAI9SY82_9ASCO|nr:uncharacterized protein KGF56_002406 [Candida oxycetoniae]KAI3404776.2 hypothetical protein KGF56_002406 [Candida oxycetoniae]